MSRPISTISWRCSRSVLDIGEPRLYQKAFSWFGNKRIVQWLQMDPRRMCPHCRAFITINDRVCPYCNERVGPPAAASRSPRALLGGFVPHASFTTVMILLLNFSMFVATTLYTMNSGASEGETLHKFGAKAYPEIVLGGQWWLLVTAGFLHGGLLHIFMNSFALFDLGAQVEEIYGANRLMVFYFVATVFGFLCSTFWSPYLSVGASAGLFGLIGAMIALGVRSKSS